MPSLGTRAKQNTRQEHIATKSDTRTHSADIGMSKRVVASVTFSAAASEFQAANGTFANFAVGDDILVQGANLNNGTMHVNAIDTVNQSFLTVDNGVKNEGPLTVTVRTI